MQQAQGVAATPYQAYTGELTAPVNAQQTLGINNINANANFASPYIQQAAGQASSSTAPITAQQIAQYQNPYTQQVVNATEAQLQNTDAQQQAQLTGNSIAQGALGGNRVGVAQGILGGQQALANNSTIAGLYNQSYQQALAAAQAQQQTGLAGANALANYGISGQNAALTGASAQVGAGTLQQQTQQAADTANYGQYAQQQAYPFQTLDWLAGIDTSVGPGLGSTSTGSTTGAAPNQLAQYLGLGLTGASLFANRGGRINGVNGYASGGVASTPWANGVGWVPSINMGNAAPRSGGSAPGLQQQPASPQIDYSKLATGIQGLTQDFGSSSYGGGNMFSGDAWGGDANNPLPGLSAADYGAAHGGGIRGYDSGGAPDSFDDRFTGDDVAPPINSGVVGVANPDQPFRLSDSGSLQAWRDNNPIPSLGTAPDTSGVAAITNPTGVATTSTALSYVPSEVSDDESDSSVDPNIQALRDTAALRHAEAYAPQPAPPNGSAPGNGLLGLSSNAKTGLLATGLGLLANRSPYLGVALGEAGEQGLAAYGAANQNDAKVAADAKKLSDEAKKAADDLALRTETLATKGDMTDYQKAQLEQKKAEDELKLRTPISLGVINGVETKALPKIDANGKMQLYAINPDGTVSDTPLAPGSSATPASGKFVSTAAPVTERRNAPAASPQARDESYYDYLDKTRPPGYADIVRGVADYEIDPNREASLQKGARDQLYRDVKLYDPTYDQTHFAEKTGVIQNFARGPAGQAVNSLNVSVDHLETLSHLGDALKNGQIPVINKIYNSIGASLGGADPTNFNSAKEIVGDEVVKAVVGGANSQADREAIKQLIMAQQSPEQLAGVIKTFQALLGGQLDGQRQRYQAGTGLNNFDQKYLSPATREALSRTRNGGVDPSVMRMVFPSGIPSSAVAPVQSGFAPPAGAIARSYQGKTYYYDPATKQPYPGQ